MNAKCHKISLSILLNTFTDIFQEPAERSSNRRMEQLISGGNKSSLRNATQSYKSCKENERIFDKVLMLDITKIYYIW